MNLAECKLTQTEKAILNILTDCYKGHAFTKEIAEENNDYSIQQVAWHLENIHKKGLLDKSKKLYKGKPYTEYKVNNFYHYGVEVK